MMAVLDLVDDRGQLGACRRRRVGADLSPTAVHPSVAQGTRLGARLDALNRLAPATRFEIKLMIRVTPTH